MESLALAAILFLAIALFEGAALAKAVADRSALLRTVLEGFGLGVESHGDSGVNCLQISCRGPRCQQTERAQALENRFLYTS